MNISLIVSIVRKGWGNRALDASIDAGASGGTLLFGRGTGVHENETIMGIPIEPEKEILLTIAPTETVVKIMNAIARACELDKPRAGVAFVVPIDKVMGAIHLSSPAKSL